MIYVKYVYRAPYCMVEVSKFIYTTYMDIHLPYDPIKYLVYMSYVLSVEGIFVCGTYLAVACEVYVVVGCILGKISQNDARVCSVIYVNRQSVLHAAWLMSVTSYMSYICIYIFSIRP